MDIDGEESRSVSSPTVAIIGCGPSGISFLHAINLKRKKMEEVGDVLGLSKLPTATCFERSSNPGGVWRAQRDHSHSMDNLNSISSGSTSMYEALWTNGPKEMFEFFDYTFLDHFNQSLPAFLPRQLVLDYFLKRIQHNEPNFFSNAKFNTEVEFVQFNKSMNKFEVTIYDNVLRNKATLYFDKCIWAAGANGLRSIPRSIESVLQKGNFQGTVMHSSSAGNFLSTVKGKRIAIIGDSLSAEDLALQAIKLGVKKVYILSRTGMGICTDVISWPKDKVRLLRNMVLTDVTEGGHGLRFSEAIYNGLEEEYDYVPNGETTYIEDISAVIYCTGYKMNFSMLDVSLRSEFEDDEGSYDLNELLENSDTPTRWVMNPNALTDSIGDVDIEGRVYSDEIAVYPGVYRGILISNTNMMYMREGNADTPLLELDVQAWLLIAHIVGDLVTPSMEEMNRWNTQRVAEYMQCPFWRRSMDPKYQMVWSETIDKNDHRIDALYKDGMTLEMENFAQDMQDASYPLDIGTAEELNEKGELLIEMLLRDDRHDIHPNDSSWRTFRDTDPSNYLSLHTGNTAAAFEKHWIDIDENDMRTISARDDGLRENDYVNIDTNVDFDDDDDVIDYTNDDESSTLLWWEYSDVKMIDTWNLLKHDELFKDERPVHNDSTWVLMRGACVGTVHPNVSPIDHVDLGERPLINHTSLTKSHIYNYSIDHDQSNLVFDHTRSYICNSQYQF